MGHSISVLLSTWKERISILLFGIRVANTSDTLRSLSLVECKKGGDYPATNVSSDEQVCKDSRCAVGQYPQIHHVYACEENSDTPKLKGEDFEDLLIPKPLLALFPQPVNITSPRPVRELDAAATKVQKFYRSYRTRRNLADCAVVIQELWWKALDFASLKQSSITYFDVEKQETVGSRWSRAKTRAAKVGQGLSKDEKARKLALQHWLEAIDPRHRYGHNLRFYYADWSDSESTQPFFYWLDIGDGKELNMEGCPRTNLQQQYISYLGPLERKSYEVTVEDQKLVYKQDGEPVNTEDGTKWIFILSTSKQLYVGRKIKGIFQHSSFLSGGATKAAGRLIARDGILEAVWPYSGHYLPTQDNFKEFLVYLKDQNVDLTRVELHSMHENNVSFSENNRTEQNMENTNSGTNDQPMEIKSAGRALSWEWTGGTGARINYVKDQPSEFQLRAFEKVHMFSEFPLSAL